MRFLHSPGCEQPSYIALLNSLKGSFSRHRHSLDEDSMAQAGEEIRKGLVA
jgi:hypothetical protein